MKRNKHTCCYDDGIEFDPLFCFGVKAPRGARVPNLVGCRKMELHIYQFYGVYHYGKWINLKGDFLYDKKHMYDLIKKAENDYFDCPYMNVKRAKSFVFWWPEIINPNVEEKVSIWPPEIGSFESELLEMGFSFRGPSPTPNGEEYPVFTDTSIFLELINFIYGNSISEEIRPALLSSYDEICWQTLHYFD